MMRNVHDEARELISLGEALPEEQQARLRAHLQECADCREYEEAAGRMVRGLRSQPLAADSTLVRETQLRVRARALELRQQRERRWLVCLSCLFVGLSAAITTPLLWRGFEWVGAWAGVSKWVWEAGFSYFWIAPALAVSVLLAAHGTHLTNNHNGGRQWR